MINIPFPKIGISSLFTGVAKLEKINIEKNENIVAERKNNVVTEKGSNSTFLLKTKNIPKIIAENKTTKSVEKLVKLIDAKLPFVKTINTPKKPKIMARIVYHVIFSLKNKTEKITIKIGQVY